MAHANSISVNNDGHLTFGSEAIKQSLLQWIDASKALMQLMINDRAKAVNNQHALQDAVGTKHTD